MKLVIGSDHRGFHFKLVLQEQIKEFNGTPIEWLDAGAFDAERTDYPIYAAKVCEEILEGNADAGILICGSGIGMSIAANRFKGIYAGLAWNETSAHLAKEHDGSNVLVLPSDFISLHDAVSMVHAWMGAKFLGGRYEKRLEMIDKLVQK
jgi:ribose 5-phosphate isomerase B